MTQQTVTREQAEAVWKVFEERYGDVYKGLYPGSPDRPRLVKDWESPVGSVAPYAIVWEWEEWVYDFQNGGFRSGEYAAAIDRLGREEAERKDQEGHFDIPPAPKVPGVFTQPATGWALAIYPL